MSWEPGSVMRYQRRFAVGLWAALAGLLAGNVWYVAGETPLASKTLALVGGRILTQTEAGTVQGTVLVRDGKIVAVGAKVEVPPDATRIDVTGYIVTPGLIDARSSFGLDHSATRDTASDATLDVLDAIDPHDDDW